MVSWGMPAQTLHGSHTHPARRPVQVGGWLQPADEALQITARLGGCPLEQSYAHVTACQCKASVVSAGAWSTGRLGETEVSTRHRHPPCLELRLRLMAEMLPSACTPLDQR